MAEFKRLALESSDGDGEHEAVAAPGQEEFIKHRKKEFQERYGDRWEEVLYGLAWKRYNKEHGK